MIARFVCPLAIFFNESKPEEFVSILAVLGFLLTGALAIKMLVRREPPLHREFATTDAVNHLSKRVDELEQRIAMNLTDFDEKGEERASKLHERINLLLTAVSEMRGEIRRLPCSSSKPCQT